MDTIGRLKCAMVRGEKVGNYFKLIINMVKKKTLSPKIQTRTFKNAIYQ